jgi:hypothetical protein
MSKLILVLSCVFILGIISCKQEPTKVYTYFYIYNNSLHNVVLDFYNSSGDVLQSLDINKDLYYEKSYNISLSCCESCFLAVVDSVVFYYDDTVKIVHSKYDTISPGNNIFNSLYFVQDNSDCTYNFTITGADYLEALGNHH